MTVYLYLGLWIDRKIRRPCAYLTAASLGLWIAHFAGVDGVGRWAAATGIVGLPPIVLMFLCMWMHNRIVKHKKTRQKRDENS